MNSVDSSKEDGARYFLRCAGCGKTCAGKAYELYCVDCGKNALLVSQYQRAADSSLPSDSFERYAPYLPFENTLGITGPTMACVHAEGLGESLGLERLWVAISGYSRRWNSRFRSGTFKECEALGVLNRVSEQTDKLLMIASAGNAGRAFLELGASSDIPVIVAMPASAAPLLSAQARNDRSPLLLLLEDAYYPDVIKFVEGALENFSTDLVREGGCFNVARRDAMAVPFLRAVDAIGKLPDWYVQAVGSGTGAVAAMESIKRIASHRGEPAATRLLLVQNAPFTPIVDAWQLRDRQLPRFEPDYVRDRVSSIRAQVLSNASPPYAVKGGVFDILAESNGVACAVDNDEIEAAQRLAERELEFVPCDASSAALAGLKKSIARGDVSKDDLILLHLTGGGFEELAAVEGAHPYSNRVLANHSDTETFYGAISAYIGRVRNK